MLTPYDNLAHHDHTDLLRERLTRAGLGLAWLHPLEVWLGRWVGIEYAIDAPVFMPLAHTLALLERYAPGEAPSDEAFARAMTSLDYVYWCARNERTGHHWSPVEQGFLSFYTRDSKSVELWQSDTPCPSAATLQAWLLSLRALV